MKITMTEKKVKLSPALIDYAEKKIGKLERLFKEDAEASVTFSVEKKQNKVELTIRSLGTVFRASESTSDMFASIDASVTTMERQIRKNKTRLEKRLRQDAYERIVEAEVSSFVEDEEQDEFNVVRTKKFPIKPMTVDEAILQMNLVGHNFFAFRDMDNGEAYAVVYQRHNGDYGLIEDAE
ncbi:MAG: ribosome-associated translation inhibitor RaiA [Eubacteriales bacterium]